MNRDSREDSIVLDLLERIDDSEAVSQRRLANDLGIALGLTNSYIKRCIGKGLIKVSQAPARRYKYYLTPHGFAEKSRLTAQFFSDSFTAFRRWRQSYDRLFAELEARGVKTVGLCGRGELVEIAVLCSLNSSVEIVGIWNPSGRQSSVRGIPVIELGGADDPDFWILAENDSARAAYERLLETVPAKRVAVPYSLRRQIEAAPVADAT
jgi:DNA-binding MarR family transcriptional regulator